MTDYEAASGQKINREKTSVYFNKNTMQETRVAIMQEVGANYVQQFERYLGLLALIGRYRVSSFNFIKGQNLDQA